MELEWITTLGDVGGIGLATLMVVVAWRVSIAGFKLAREELVPMVTNHLKHVEDAFEKLSDSHERLIDTQERIITKLDDD